MSATLDPAMLGASGGADVSALEGDAPHEVAASDSPDEPALDKLRRWIGAGNIAEELGEDRLGAIAQRVLQDYKIDDESRADWKEKYRKWMKVATQVVEAKTYPWPGSSNVQYPLLTVAAITFSARAYPAIVRGREVVRGRVEGADDDGPQAQAPAPGGMGAPPMLAPPGGAPMPQGAPWMQPPGGMPAQSAPAMAPQGMPQGMPPPGMAGPQGMSPTAPQSGGKRSLAERIGQHMSWQILEEMDGWEEETDRLLLVLSIVGSMFRKTYYDPAKRKNVSELVEALRLCINYNAKSFDAAPRMTEEIDLYPWEIEERIRGGVFLDRHYQSNTDMSSDVDSPTTFLEQHRRWDLDGDGYAEPYIVTVSRDGGQLARIVAGYDLDTIFLDPTSDEIVRVDPVAYYTKYAFIPNPESPVYDLGFGALLYPINEAVNSTLNQMFDAGHLANAGGGFIGSGLSMNTGTVSFAIGEYKVVNTPGATLRENLVPLNFPGPNPVLFELLGFLVEAAKDVASVKDILSGALPGANVPGILGLAVIQQGLKVFSAVFKRVHRSLAAEYRKLFRLNRLYLPDQSGYRIGGKYFRVDRQDYERGHGVEPVSDPDAAIDMQQMARANFLLQFANDPYFNGMEVRRFALESAGIPDIERYLLRQPMPNPEITARAAELHLRALKEARGLDIQQGRDKAGEVRDLAQAILFLAQASKSDADVDLGWIDRHMKALEVQLDALSGGQGGGTGGPPAAPQGPIGGGFPGMAPPPGQPGLPSVPPGLPG